MDELFGHGASQWGWRRKVVAIVLVAVIMIGISYAARFLVDWLPFSVTLYATVGGLGLAAGFLLGERSARRRYRDGLVDFERTD